MSRWVLIGVFSVLVHMASGRNPMPALLTHVPLPESADLVRSWAQTGQTTGTVIPSEVAHFSSTFLTWAQDLSLTGWFLIQACDAVAGQISREPIQRSRILWLLLKQAGIGTALYSSDSDTQVLVSNDEAEFNISVVRLGAVRFVNVSSLLDPARAPIGKGILSGICPGSTCRFAITAVPLLPDMHQDVREIQFRHHGRSVRISLEYNRTYAEWLHTVPFTNYTDHIVAPMSTELSGSVQTAFASRLTGLSGLKQSEYLLAFIRTGFGYRKETSDQDEWPLTAEQMLLWGSGDCEDRTAFFYAMAVQLLHVPVAVVDFIDHQGIALGIQSPYGDELQVNGISMKYCEPTDLQDVLRAGERWGKYEDADYRIFALHEPGN